MDLIVSFDSVSHYLNMGCCYSAKSLEEQELTQGSKVSETCVNEFGSRQDRIILNRLRLVQEKLEDFEIDDDGDDRRVSEVKLPEFTSEESLESWKGF